MENKGTKLQLPKLKVASSSLVARSKFAEEFFIAIFKFKKRYKRPPNVPQILHSQVLAPDLKLAGILTPGESTLT